MIERLLRTHLAGFPARTILDVGPGYADFSRIAAAVTGASHITFLDFDENVLTWQMERCRQSRIQATPWRVRLDISEIQQSASRFDLIHCQEVLEHLPNAERVLGALAGLLTPEGRIIITVPTGGSERWLTWLNAGYMRDEPHGHVRQFDRPALLRTIQEAGLEPLAFVPTQPHYFLAHTWLFGTRMKTEGSTGRILTRGLRGFVLGHLTSSARRFFLVTGPDFWGRVLPRNYFVVAAKGGR
jgi:SAM-dependent methyltransferase